ncbi:MAG: transposase [Sedimentisphaerales bacterium]|nr:transposase [Sedimentisphaerales bacterium]
MYDWRKMTDPERVTAYVDRYIKPAPWHSPPHFDMHSKGKWFILTAACYEHKGYIGYDSDRMTRFCIELLEICASHSDRIRCWCLLPNHYHLLLHTDIMPELRYQIRLLHGRTSRSWNLEEQAVGRKVWHNCIERAMRCESHFWSSVNYIHHNPVKHGYVDKWQDWPFSSARTYLNEVGHEFARNKWHNYPITGYGDNWDID